MIKPPRRMLPSFLAILGMLASTPSVYAVTTPVEPGDLVKSPSSSAVYEIADDGSRLVFQMQSVYESWYGRDFSKVRTLSESDLAAIPLRRVKSFRPGSVVKSPSLSKVYVVSDALELKSIANESDFRQLGYSFSQVKDVPDAFFTSYKIVGEMTIPQPQTPPPSPEPEPTPDVQFEIISRSFTASNGQAGTVHVETSLPSKLTLSYAPENAPNLLHTQSSNEPNTSHNFLLTELTPSTKYTYTLTATKEDNSLLIEETGTFVSYYDLFVSAHSSAPSSGSVRQPDLEVGRFFVYNNSTNPYTFTELWFQFNSSNAVTDKVPRTIKIIDVTPGSDTYGTVVSYKNIGTGTNIRNATNIQKFQFLDIPIDSGKHRIFSVVITNLENVNPAEFDGSTFVTTLEKVVTAGDPAVYVQDTQIGTRYNALP